MAILRWSVFTLPLSPLVSQSNAIRLPGLPPLLLALQSKCCSPLLLPPSPTSPTPQPQTFSIIAAKGATSYGIASIVSSICESILFNQRHVRPVSHWVKSFGTYLSLPAVLGHGGIQKTIDIPLNENERQMLKKSIDEIKENVRIVEEKAW